MTVTPVRQSELIQKLKTETDEHRKSAEGLRYQ